MIRNLCTVRPFASAPAIVAPVSIAEIAAKLNLPNPKKSGVLSVARKQTLLSAAISLAGKRKPTEKAEHWVLRAQGALNSAFPVVA